MKFVPNRSVITIKPSVTVDAGLPVGKHRFQLVVENKDGDRSTPAEIVVTIVDKSSRRPLPFKSFRRDTK